MKILLYVSWPVHAWSIPGTAVEALRRRFPDIEFVHAQTADEALTALPDVDAALAARLTPEMVAAAARLRWVHSSAVNVLGLLPLPELAARGIAISNSRGIQGGPIAETVLGGLLMLRRKLVQTLDAQRDALTAAGAAKVYQEKVSGAAIDRRELGRLLASLEAGDTLLVTRLDRLARSTLELLRILERVAEAGAGFRSLADTWADTTTPRGGWCSPSWAASRSLNAT
jgi:phosphoglycerate dehydrogenase-like enzyme